jgi:AcrR family transcriptional regulator
LRRKHDKSEILQGALAVAFDDGLSSLTFGRVARRLGINDRTVVYYFPTKADLIAEVITSMGIELQGALAEAFTASAATHLELARAAWPVLAHPNADPIFALFFEANGLAAAGIDPYHTLVPQLVDSWIAWSAEFFIGDAEHRHAEAAAAIALIDGLLLLRQLAGHDTAQRAATSLGIT